MPVPSTDEPFLRRALDLARQGIGLASPNPHVGAAIVDSHNNIVGEGCYTYAGVKHAEVLALAQAREKARGATLYINLEPHSHQGRTPPCTDALIAAGVRRVVASMADPNPKVSGQGFQKLREAGIEVEVGGLETEARRLNEAFARYILYGVPLVTLKSAMTLDAKIAPPQEKTLPRRPGVPPGGWITSEASRAHVQEQRHESDAIMAGIGTVLADDPLLTDRSGNPRRRPLLRVILDSHLRMPMDSQLVRTAKNDVLVFCLSSDKESRGEKTRSELEARGVQIEEVGTNESGGKLDLRTILQRLGQLEITSLMIEGGSTLNAAALSSGIVDKVSLYYAPEIMGSASAVPFMAGGLGKSRQLKDVTVYRFDDDVEIEGYLRDPYSA